MTWRTLSSTSMVLSLVVTLCVLSGYCHTAVTATEEINIFSGHWYQAKDSGHLSAGDSVRWEFPKRGSSHLENHGVATHFSKTKLEVGHTYTIRAVWESKGQDKNLHSQCPAKYWQDAKYEHSCVVFGDDCRKPCRDKCSSKSGSAKTHCYEACDKEAKGGCIHYPCRGMVECPRDTGDFRIVLAASNGGQITHSPFSDLEDVTGKWDGFHWRIMPHTASKFKRRSLIFPNTVWMKNPKEKRHPGMFAHSSSVTQVLEMRDQADTGGFDVANGRPTNVEITIKRESTTKFRTHFKMNGRTYSTSWNFASSIVPEYIDTLAIAQPNYRDIEYLKLSPAKSTGFRTEATTNWFTQVMQYLGIAWKE
eukprot:GFYU01004512.1.p1 GENE.GFYU01004512.1~~GFYU01004512.1.p1  ORF type:complete len:364 (-),score=91.28 GFYU01004512.1:54-1145(-)